MNTIKFSQAIHYFYDNINNCLVATSPTLTKNMCMSK